jgi:hypothetical protein
VAESVTGRAVGRFEYRFPTSRGEHKHVGYDRSELKRAGPMMADLLELIGSGAFVATDEPDDCRWCNYAGICRVTLDDRDVRSPRAEWSREHGPGLAQYATLRRLRGEP